MRIMRYFLSELCYNFLSITCGLQGLLVRDPGVSLPPFPLPPRAPTGGGWGGRYWFPLLLLPADYFTSLHMACVNHSSATMKTDSTECKTHFNPDHMQN